MGPTAVRGYALWGNGFAGALVPGSTGPVPGHLGSRGSLSEMELHFAEAKSKNQKGIGFIEFPQVETHEILV